MCLDDLPSSLIDVMTEEIDSSNRYGWNILDLTVGYIGSRGKVNLVSVRPSSYTNFIFIAKLSLEWKEKFAVNRIEYGIELPKLMPMNGNRLQLAEFSSHDMRYKLD